ncbi:hypothetical protein ScPMuIL_018561 [Solemya velum]
MVKVVVDNQPRLCLFAIQDISKDTELRYDYGVADGPWRKQKKNEVRPVVFAQPSTCIKINLAADTGTDDTLMVNTGTDDTLMVNTGTDDTLMVNTVQVILSW